MCIKKILVPIDLSENSRKAVDYALRLGHAQDAEVTVCYAVDSRDLIGFGREVEEFAINLSGNLRREYENALKAFLKDHVPADKVHEKVEVGYPPRSIMKHAEKEKPDLIVMSVDGARGADPTCSGLIGAIVAHSRCPVLLMGPKASAIWYGYAEIEQTAAENAGAGQQLLNPVQT